MKKVFIVVLCVFASLFSVGCCSTTETVEEVIVPDMKFPEWPNPGQENFSFDDETDTISVPLNYWEKLFYYKNDIEALEEYYNGIRKLYMEADENEC